MISVDSYGWIERFGGGPKCSQYDRIIDGAEGEEIVTSMVTVYEVYKRAKERRGELAALEDVAALGQTRLVPVDQEIALAAADYSLEFKLIFSDALVYATARRFHAELYTSDADLKHLPGVMFI